MTKASSSLSEISMTKRARKDWSPKYVSEPPEPLLKKQEAMRIKHGVDGIPRMGEARRIIREAEERYGLSDLRVKSNTPILVAARRQAARKLREIGRSYNQIGHLLGVHHTTVMNYIRKTNGKWLRDGPSDSSPFDPTVPDFSGEWSI